MSDQNETSQNPDDDGRYREGIDFIQGVVDQRLTAWMDTNMPAIIDSIADRVAKTIDPASIATQAERIFEQRWNEAARQRQAVATGGGGDGNNGARPTASGGDDDDPDDVSFLGSVEDGGSEGPAAAYPASNNARQAVAVGGLRLLEDPLASIERMMNVVFDVMDRCRPQTPQRNDLDVIEDLAQRRPYLIDLFATPDPQSAPERLAEAMMNGAKSGMSVAEAWGKYLSRGAAGKSPPTWKPPVIEAETPPQPEPEPAAPMGQDRPKRRRRRLRDAV